MAEEYVNCYLTQLPNPQINAWLEANQVNPNTVLADQHILLKDGKLVYVGWPQGPKEMAAGYPGFRKQARIVPLLVRPEAFGLEVLRG